MRVNILEVCVKDRALRMHKPAAQRSNNCRNQTTATEQSNNCRRVIKHTTESAERRPHTKYRHTISEHTTKCWQKQAAQEQALTAAQRDTRLGGQQGLCLHLSCTPPSIPAKETLNHQTIQQNPRTIRSLMKSMLIRCANLAIPESTAGNNSA